MDQPPDNLPKRLDETTPDADSAEDASRARADGGIYYAASYVGPLPPPAMLAAYEKVMPGLARTIVENFANEVEHRRQLDLEDINTSRQQAQLEAFEFRRGQYFALTIGVACLVTGATVSIVAIVKQNAAGIVVGGTIGVAGVVALVTAFLAHRRVRQIVPPSTATVA